MREFEYALLLSLGAIVLLQVSRKLGVPYPTVLAIAGIALALSPLAPDLSIDPRTALALFIAPALLESAYAFPACMLRRLWMPLLALSVFAVILTTSAVAWLAADWYGMPWAAAVALGAIVSPPDTAAATATIVRLPLPRAVVAILTGESLLNDSVALLIYGLAVSASTAPRVVELLPALALSLPGALILGFIVGKGYLYFARYLSGTLSGLLLGFVVTFGIWIVAEHLQVSSTMTVVALAMTVAQSPVDPFKARDRIYARALWELVVFVLNVAAFLLLGVQARETLEREFSRGNLAAALAFAGAVFAVVVAARLICAFAYWRLLQSLSNTFRQRKATARQSLVVGWCGMRGLVTLATALALPPSFPARDRIVLGALAVVLGTLVLQGLTLTAVIRAMRFRRDETFAQELTRVRAHLHEFAALAIDGQDEEARLLRQFYEREKARSLDGARLRSIDARRRCLSELRHSGAIDDEVFRELERELDLAELALSPRARMEVA